jgi:hypothetical protein
MKKMCARAGLFIVVMLLVMTGCTATVNWQENPARARLQTETAGTLVIATYFAADKTASTHAGDIVATIDAIKAIIGQTPTSLPVSGFATLMPTIDARLTELLTGDNSTFLPSARLLALMLLQELQLKADEGNWLAAAPADVSTVLDMINAFLKGARDAAAVFAVPAP